jgi:phage terminase large subunit
VKSGICAGAQRFGVLVCHRRFGKTVLGVNVNQQTAHVRQAAPRRLHRADLYAGQGVAWDYMQFYARPIPGIQFQSIRAAR